MSVFNSGYHIGLIYLIQAQLVHSLSNVDVRRHAMVIVNALRLALDVQLCVLAMEAAQTTTMKMNNCDSKKVLLLRVSVNYIRLFHIV